jgi:hypothetical protein
MYTTIIHPIRVALQLSCEEYLVLDKICKLSNNIKYGGWCVAPQAKLAEWLGLPTSNVSRHIQTLIDKGLVLKDPVSKHLRSADLWNEIEANSHDWAVAFKGTESAFISAKMVNDKLTGVQTESGTHIPKWDEKSQNGTRNPKMGQNKVVHIEDNKEDIYKGSAKNRFTPPLIEEVRKYCEERNNGINPEAWVDHYLSNGWMVGKVAMKDWRAAIRTWEQRQKKEGGKKTFHQFSEQDLTNTL